MKRLQILCSKKENKNSFRRMITHVGGVNGTGERWNISISEAIKEIELGSFQFYIKEKSGEIPVIVDGDIEKSLIAKGLGYLHNLLEDLPDCP